MRYLFFLLIVLATCSTKGQFRTDSLLTKLLAADTSAELQRVIQQPDKYRVQIIYTQIDRDAQNRPSFRNFYFHEKKDYYYYPASTVKLPLAVLSLEKLHGLQAYGVNKFTRIEYDSSYSGEVALNGDSTAADGYPSIGQFIRKAFLISDNDAYNRMYEFMGQRAIDQRLQALGFTDCRIVRQFMPFTEAQNRQTNAIRFRDARGKLLYEQPAASNPDSFSFSWPALIGKGYKDAHDSLIPEPKNFTRHNRIPLEDLQQMLQRVLFPSSVPRSLRYHVTAEDRSFLLRYLSQFPSETAYPYYDTAKFYDTYVKFFFQKGGRHLPDGIRVFNKVGWAYGFLTDVSYVVDFNHHIEFMLTATVYANEDEILNDDTYEYETLALPFLYRVGQDVYSYDLHRQRKQIPDLGVFRLRYDHRNPKDRRTPVSVVDN